VHFVGFIIRIFQYVDGRTEENQKFSITLFGLLVANQSRRNRIKNTNENYTMAHIVR
jgi:hypothetical protein